MEAQSKAMKPIPTPGPPKPCMPYAMACVALAIILEAMGIDAPTWIAFSLAIAALLVDWLQHVTWRKACDGINAYNQKLDEHQRREAFLRATETP